MIRKAMMFLITTGAVTLIAATIDAATTNAVFLSEEEQRYLLGAVGNEDESCTGTGTCSVCVAPTGCPYWGGSVIGGCSDDFSACTTAGSDGCATAAAMKVCKPDPNENCKPGQGGANDCGAFSERTVSPTNTSGTWTCVGGCGSPSGGSIYCVDCK